MKATFLAVDSLLRGELTDEAESGARGLDIPLATLVKAGVGLGAIYGIGMGLYAVMHPTGPGVAQMLASALKVPLLFLLTLVVTLPSLYVVSALSRSALRALDTVRLLLLTVVVNLALLASLAPITAFFTLSTESYPFMVLLNVAFFTVSGGVGIAFLRRVLGRVYEADAPRAPGPRGPGASKAAVHVKTKEGDEVLPDDTRPRQQDRAARISARRVLGIWLFLYGVVGAQMGWILRPFIGSPDLPFAPFRPRDSNFFEAVLLALRQLLS